MGKLQAFEVLFDGNVDVYGAGDTITGHVRLVLNEAKEFKGKRFPYTINKISSNYLEVRRSETNTLSLDHLLKVSKTTTVFP